VFSVPFSHAVNRLLRDAPWAAARLGRHPGRRVRFEMPPAAVSVEIGPDGYLKPLDSAEAFDLTVEVTPAAAIAFLRDRGAAWKHARVEGDAELAASVSFVAAHLRWDFEEDLSRVFGDALAQRMGAAVRAAAAWPAAAVQSAAANAAEYLTEERHLLPTRLQAEAFLQGVDELRDAAERLEKRLERLEARSAGRADH
jgi:ubiquinone biosynthesis protein UbiJ